MFEAIRFWRKALVIRDISVFGKDRLLLRSLLGEFGQGFASLRGWPWTSLVVVLAVALGVV